MIRQESNSSRKVLVWTLFKCTHKKRNELKRNKYTKIYRLSSLVLYLLKCKQTKWKECMNCLWWLLFIFTMNSTSSSSLKSMMDKCQITFHKNALDVYILKFGRFFFSAWRMTFTRQIENKCVRNNRVIDCLSRI